MTFSFAKPHPIQFAFFCGAVLAALRPDAAMAKGAPVLPEGTRVRVIVPDLSKGAWIEGKIGVAANGCTMIFLDQKARSGHTSVLFGAHGKVQMQLRDGHWEDVRARELSSRQPIQCQGRADND